MSETPEQFLYVKEDFIEHQSVLDYLFSITEEQDYQTNWNKPWGDDILPNGGGVVKLWEHHIKKDQKVLNYLAHKIKEKFPEVQILDNISYDMKIYQWEKDSFIPWHLDGDFAFALTCYLYCDSDHGGEFLFCGEDQTIGSFISPVFNRAILSKNVPHSTTKLNSGKRITLQIFGHYN